MTSDQQLLDNHLAIADMLTSFQANALKWLLDELRQLKHRVEQQMKESLESVSAKDMESFEEELNLVYRAEGPIIQAAQDGLRAYSVILASWIEFELNFRLRMCGEKIKEGCYWNETKQAFENAANKSLDSLAKWEQVQDVREFANQFKHNNGKATQRLIFNYPTLGFLEGSYMDYSKPNWEVLTDAVAEFLAAAVGALVKAASSPLVEILRKTHEEKD